MNETINILNINFAECDLCLSFFTARKVDLLKLTVNLCYISLHTSTHSVENNRADVITAFISRLNQDNIYEKGIPQSDRHTENCYLTLLLPSAFQCLSSHSILVLSPAN